MKKRIVFVSIFDLTRVFWAIAEGLISAGHTVFWITTNEYWTSWLIERGVSRNDIQQLVYSNSDFLSLEEKRNLNSEIIESEANAGVTFNQALMMDQFVTTKNKSDINEYLYLYYRDIKRFLIDKNPTHLFAEPTNCNEMITYMVCKELDIKFISPRDIRYPAKHMAFFDSYLQKNQLPLPHKNSDSNGQELIEAFANNKPTPHYFKKNSAIKALRVSKLIGSMRNRISRRFIESGNGLTHHDLSGRISLALKQTFNSFYMKHLCRYDKLEDITNRVAFFALHVQPEASIDVLGSFYSDQIKLIKDIRRSLPFDTTLIVKEHPNFLGIKNLSFFRKLRRIPNVKQIKFDVSTFDVYQKTDIIFTVSGTVGYEGGMLGIPVITFCPMYFGGLSSVHLCEDVTKIQPLAKKLLNGFKRNYEVDYQFMESLVKKSYPAFWSDPISNPDVLSNENINSLLTAFLKVISRADS
ncbi:MAG: hypothetical protein KAR42_07190 [candidate division Zixibacteria bacterium]|nr:hypothetical protein [candidate division Zixibacteria bacterium]